MDIDLFRTSGGSPGTPGRSIFGYFDLFQTFWRVPGDPQKVHIGRFDLFQTLPGVLETLGGSILTV